MPHLVTQSARATFHKAATLADGSSRTGKRLLSSCDQTYTEMFLPRMNPTLAIQVNLNLKTPNNHLLPKNSTNQPPRTQMKHHNQSLTLAPIPPPTNQTSCTHLPILTPTTASAPNFKLPPNALLTASYPTLPKLQSTGNLGVTIPLPHSSTGGTANGTS